MDTPARVCLDGAWSLTYGPESAGPGHPDRLDAVGWPTIPARVPGRVEESLVAAGLEPDPQVGRNAWRFGTYEHHEWWYEREIEVPALPAGHRWQLVFDGLDCLGTVWVDGVEIGRTDNMFIVHRLDLELAPGRHRLAVRLGSAINEARRHEPAIGGLTGTCNWESWRVRKAAHQYGWDILPRLVSAGLWRSVRLEAVAAVGVRSAYWTTTAVDPEKRTAKAWVAWTFDLPETSEWSSYSWRITLERGGRTVLDRRGPVLAYHGRSLLDLADVDLWWPRGWGEAALHRATVELVAADGRVLGRRSEDIGFRTVILQRSEATTAGGDGDFAFIVNGRRLYARGTNWVGLDALNRFDAAKLDESMAMLAELECNMVRCWGGAPYEDEAFYDACDRHGFLVWQDFALACTVPPQDDAFAAAMEREARAVVRRLRNRACIGLWCGGNENDEAHGWCWLALDPNDDRISRRVLPAVVRDLDPVRSYLPGSPYLSPAVMAGGARPEDHLWGPRDDFMNPYYRTSAAHFVSEMGFHGCPEAASLARMAQPGEPLWPLVGNPALAAQGVRAMERHGDFDYRIPLMTAQTSLLTGVAPTDLDGYVLASQITQAEAFKSFIETGRLRKGRVNGILWWNLRDGWPLISDAVVDWYGRRKAAYAVIRHSQALSVALVDEPVDGSRRIAVVNDALDPVEGALRVSDIDGSVLLETRACIATTAAVTVGELPEARTAACWRLEWTPVGGRTVVNHALVGGRPYALADLARWYRSLGLELPEPATGG